MRSEAEPLRAPVQRRPWPWWVGDLVGMVLIVALAFAPIPGEEFRPATPYATVAVLLPAAFLPLRRRWPIGVLAACVVVYGVAALTGILAPGVILAAAITMFGLASRSTRRVTTIAAGSAAVAVVVLSLLAALGNVFDPRVLQFAIVIAFAAAAGDASRSRREFVQAVTERAERAEQTRESEARRQVSEERLRIARDLHDAVAHQISVISLNAGVASSSIDSRPEAARDALAAIRTASRTVLGEIGDLLAVLRSTETGELEAAQGQSGQNQPDQSRDQVSPPQPGLQRLDELVDRFRAAGLEVTVRVEGDVTRMPLAADIVAYRVIQEGLTNASKHGSPRRAHLLVSIEDDLARIVLMNPVSSAGSPETAVTETAGRASSGYGLVGLSERVSSVRGTVEVGPANGGYRMTAELPLARGDES